MRQVERVSLRRSRWCCGCLYRYLCLPNCASPQQALFYLFLIILLINIFIIIKQPYTRVFFFFFFFFEAHNFLYNIAY